MGAHRRNEELKVLLVAPNAWGLTRIFERDPIDSGSMLDLSVMGVTAYFGRSSDQAADLKSIEEALQRRQRSGC
jgi:hypothetical protein